VIAEIRPKEARSGAQLARTSDPECRSHGTNAMMSAVPLEPVVGATTSVVYASWVRRLMAWILDNTFLGLLVTLPLVMWPGSADDAEGLLYVVFWPLAAILWGGYFTLFHGGKQGQTPAKRLLGIAVRDQETEERIDYGRAFGRWFLFVVFWSFLWVPGIVDGLWPLRDAKKRALHDRIVRSVVVRV
jgi:uncharacterized RDD family membrane protein YckC